VRIVIAEDSVLLRAGLTRILVDAGEDVVATVGDADELLTVIARHQPDLAMVDVRMPPTPSSRISTMSRSAARTTATWARVAAACRATLVRASFTTK